MLHLFRQQSQLDDLRRNVDELRRVVNGLELEWSEMHDRIRRMLAKISRRQQREDAAENTKGEEGGNGPGDVGAAVSTRGSSLTPRQIELQRQIIARRSPRSVPMKEGE